MPAVTIRRAGRQDAAAVRDLMTAAYAHYVERIGRRPAPMDEDYSRVLQDADAWVAEDAGRVVGAVVTYRQAGHLQLDSIAVEPRRQGEGLGCRLLRLAEEHARRCGLGQVRLYTNEAMTENLDFYARAGYREIGRGEQDGFRRVFFVKELPAADVGQRPPAVAGDGPVDPSRDAVAQTLVQALSDIDAIASLWVTGSLAQGRGDRFSDLDLVALGAPGQVFPRGAVRAALTASPAPVLVDERDFGASVLFSLVTPDRIRVDLDLFRADATPWRTAESVRPLLQRGPASPAWAPAAAAASNENDRATGEAIIGPVREIVRVLGLLPVVLGRGHLVTGFAGCGLLATHLLTLAGRLAELAGAEAKPAGAMAAEGRLPAAYRDILGELPAAALRAESIREFHVSAWRALGELLAAAGRDLPVELEPAARALSRRYADAVGRPLPPLDRPATRPGPA